MIILVVWLMLGGFAFAESAESPCWYSGSGGFSEHRGCLELDAKKSLHLRRSHLRDLRFAGDFATA